MTYSLMVVICSQVCDSPQRHKGKPVISLEETDLCSLNEWGPAGDFYQPIVTTSSYVTTTAATTIPATITVSSPRPPRPPPPTTTTTPAAAAPTTDTSAFVELHTEYHRVVTWSWYQSFTRFIEWSEFSGSKLVGSRDLVTHAALPIVRPSTESPASLMTTTVETTKSVHSTVTSTTQRLQVVAKTIPTEATTTSTPSLGQIIAVRGAGVFCLWLFAGCLLLCVASAACILATWATLVIWYRRVYKPLSVTMARRRRGGGGEGVRLLTISRTEEKEVAGGGGVMALYRSVLFIHREGGEAMEREDGGNESEGGGGKERLLVTLGPTGGGGATRAEEGERKGRVERGVYRKTLYRLLSKEKEIEGWRDVMEECRVSAEDGGRRGGGRDEGKERERSGGGVSRKCYSVILREEREEAGAGREELDWVVGGWEVKSGGGGEEPRSSWGEWLAHYLPSMPWGVTTPPEGEAAQGL